MTNHQIYNKDEKAEYHQYTDSFWASPDGDKLITIGVRTDFIEKEKGDGKANNQKKEATKDIKCTTEIRVFNFQGRNLTCLS